MTSLWRHLGLADMTPGARRGLIYLLILGLTVNTAAFWLSARSVGDVRRQQTALHGAVLKLCKFNADLGGAPITVNPATGKASLLGVSIVVDARQVWHGLGCPGRLPRAAPSLVKWARYYKLPYR